MKRFTTFLLLATAVTLSGCSQVRESWQKRQDRLGYENPFYAQYLNPNNPLDRQIRARMQALQANPDSPTLHNELGALLLQKGMHGDAEREFLRAIDSDRRFYPAWYNLALTREADGDHAGMARALRRTLAIKPGHAQAHFLIGLMAEKRGDNDEAVVHYARAFEINKNMIDVRSNPRIVDTRLVDRALMRLYPDEHARRAIQLQPAPPGYTPPEPRERPEAASPEPEPADIVTPSAPATESGTQAPVPPPGSGQQQ